ncbi:cilia- and flagella-associated protein 44-like [Babylonia areolata]|uniref:cilia- and flagella-associated protein 44-like n=1 Tax=Babylonia areolata TaxID=304850 RepID=UPI003FD54088
MLTVWNWIQETVLLRCKAFSQEVNHVSFNRELDGALCTAGSGHIKFWHMARTFTGLKLQGQVGRFGRSPISDIEGYLEFPDGKVLSGSEWGNLLLWDEQLIKVQIGRKGGNPCHTGQVMHIMMVEGEIITAGTDGYVRSWNFEQIDVLEAGEESALVEVDPMSEVFIGPSVSVYFLTQTARMKAIKHEPTEGDKKSDSLHEDETTRHTWYCQDGNGGIWQADLSFRLAAVPPKRLLNFHSGAIVACAVSPITYLVMTLGEDGTLRLYDFLKKKLLAVKVFKAKGCSLVWIPVYVDRFCATVLAGFSDGAIRRVVIDGSTTTLFGVDRMECQLKLLAALRPHSAPVTGMAYSTQEKAPGFAATPGIHVCSLATCSEDKTIFFFHVVSADNYIPFCYVPLRYVPRHVVWSPDSGTRHHLLITCQDGIVIEMREPKAANTAETLEYRTVEMREMKFHSVKSQILHDAEVEKEREGLETPSKQNLRIEAEDAAASEKKAKEEAENPWEAYIPPVPSPILQALYPEGESTFWLMLGDYDAGYFYECRFTRPFLMEGFEEFPAEPEYTQPVRAVPLECGDEEAITALCFNAEGNCVFMGMGNGHIRLLFLKTDYDLATQSMTWSQGFHDGTQGAIQSLCLSFDEAFLVSVGQDSNFFVFSLMPEDQLRDQIEVKQANVPAGDKVPDEPEADDISADDYTIEQFKQKSDYDEMVKQAEKRKQEKRVEIAALRSKFKLLQATNNELPPRHRLTPEEFVMERSLALELEEQKKKRAELGYRKLHDFYRKHVQSDFFCVRAIKTDHVIYSYRLDDRENRRGKIVKREATLRSEHGDADESAGEEEGDEAELTRLLGCSPHTAEDIMGASQRTMYLLKKVILVGWLRLKRARRKIAWRKFMETKPADDVADPADVEAIQWAQYTLGDRPLKADSSYKVPDSYRLTMADGAVRLQKCQNQLEKLQMSFNNKLLALREEKVQTLAEIQKCSTGLQEIQDRLAAVHYLVIPIPPTMGIDEQVGTLTQHLSLRVLPSPSPSPIMPSMDSMNMLVL